MSFFIILPILAIGGFIAFRILMNQNSEENSIAEPVSAVENVSEVPSEVLGEPASDDSVAEVKSPEPVDANGLTEDENWLIKQFVCFPDEYHNLTNIREVLCIGKADSAWADSLVKSLSKKGFLLEPVHSEVFKMNPDFTEIIMQSDPPTPEDVEMYAETVTSNLHIEKSIYEDVDDYPWIPFGRAILERFPNADDETIALLQNEMGMVLNQTGDFKGAVNYYSKAMKFYEKAFGKEHENTAVLYLNSANVYKQLGDLEKAKPLLESALGFYEKNYGELHPDTAMVYSWLGTILQETGDCDNAQLIFEKLLRSDQHNFGESHQNTATAYAHLARVGYSCGNYTPALANASRSLAILTELFPEGHDEIEAMKNGVAVIKERMATVGVPG